MQTGQKVLEIESVLMEYMNDLVALRDRVGALEARLLLLPPALPPPGPAGAPPTLPYPGVPGWKWEDPHWKWTPPPWWHTNYPGGR